MKLTGFKELEREIERLSKAAGKGVLRRSLKIAALPIAAAANAAAPVGSTGGLAKSFNYSPKLNKRQLGLHKKMFRNNKAAVAGFVGTNDPAGIQQEFGNQSHGPQPTLRPAWDAEGAATVDRLGEVLWTEIEKTVARAARKAAKG